MEKVLLNIDYIVAVILFTIGLTGLVLKKNLLKKLIALNVMETSIYLFFIASGDIRIGKYTHQWASANFIKNVAKATAGEEVMINPVPTGLILTAIVVCVCVTAFSLSLIIKIYEHYGTLDADKIRGLKG